eukprot:m51a1_g8749 putative small subunit processome component 20 homolog (2820) ;mRNA; r:75055-85154
MFIKLAERIDKISVDVFRTGQAPAEAPDEGARTFTNEALAKWRELNLTGHYAAASAELIPMARSLPLLLHNAQNFAAALARHLRVPGSLALKPLLDVLAQFARDLQGDFFPHFRGFVELIAKELLDVAQPELMEDAFTAVAYMFKHLQRQLVEGFLGVFEWYKDLLAHRRPFVRRFASESASFLLRRAPRASVPALMAAFAAHVDSAPEARAEEFAEGVGALLFEVVKGVRGAFHSRMPEFLSAALAQLDAHDSAPYPERRFRTVWEMVRLMQKHVRSVKCASVWPVLLAEAKRVAGEQSPRPVQAAFVAAVANSWLAYRSGSTVPQDDDCVLEMALVLSRPALLRCEGCPDATRVAALELVRRVACMRYTLPPAPGASQKMARLCSAPFQLAECPRVVLGMCTEAAYGDADAFNTLFRGELAKYIAQVGPTATSEVASFLISVYSPPPPEPDPADPTPAVAEPAGVPPLTTLGAVTPALRKAVAGFAASLRWDGDLAELWGYLCALSLQPRDKQAGVELRKLLDAAMATVKDWPEGPQPSVIVSECFATLSQLCAREEAAALVPHCAALLRARPSDARVLETAGNFLQSLGDRRPDTLSLYDELCPVLRENLLSPSRPLRARTLKVLRYLASEQELEILDACLKVEESPLQLSTMGDITLGIEFVERRVRAGMLPKRCAVFAAHFLMGVMHTKLSPVWPVARVAMESLARADFKQFWDVFWPQVLKSEQAINDASHAARGDGEEEEKEDEDTADLPTPESDAEADEPPAKKPKTETTSHKDTSDKAKNDDDEDMPDAAAQEEEEDDDDEKEEAAPGPSRDTSIEAMFPARAVPINAFEPLGDLFARACVSGRDEASTDAATLNTELWKAVEALADLIESQHSRVVVPMFTDFVDANPEALFGRWSEASRAGRGRKLTSRGRPIAEARIGQRAASARLMNFLQLFSKFSAPSNVCQTRRLREIFVALLESRDAKLQEMAFRCLVAWRVPAAVHLRERFERLLSPRTFHEELGLFVVSDPEVVSPALLPEAMELLSHLLYPALFRSSRNATKGTPTQTRSTVMQYFSSFGPAGVPRVLDRLLAPLRMMLEDAGKETARPLLSQLGLVAAAVEPLAPHADTEQLSRVLDAAADCAACPFSDVRAAAVRLATQLASDAPRCYTREASAKLFAALRPYYALLDAKKNPSPPALFGLIVEVCDHTELVAALPRTGVLSGVLTYVSAAVSAKNVETASEALGCFEAVVAARESDDPEVREAASALVVDSAAALLASARAVVGATGRRRTSTPLADLRARLLAALGSVGTDLATSGRPAKDLAETLLAFVRGRHESEAEADEAVQRLLAAMESLARGGQLDMRPFVPKLTSLFSVVRSSSSRVALCALLTTLAETGVAPWLADVAPLLAGINAVDSAHSVAGDADYDARQEAYRRIAEGGALQSLVGAGQSLDPIVSNLLFFAADADRLTRDNAVHALCRVVAFVAERAPKLAPQLVFRYVVGHASTALFRGEDGAEDSWCRVLEQVGTSFPTQFPDIAALAESYEAEVPGHACDAAAPPEKRARTGSRRPRIAFREKNAAGADSAKPSAQVEQTNFWRDWADPNLAVRRRATERFRAVAAEGRLTSAERASRLFIPVFLRVALVETNDEEQQATRDAAAAAVGACHRALGWLGYVDSLTRMTKMAVKKPVLENSVVRCMCEAVENFHYEVAEAPSNEREVKESIDAARGEPDAPLCITFDIGTVLEKPAPPSLNEVREESDDEEEEEEEAKKGVKKTTRSGKRKKTEGEDEEEPAEDKAADENAALGDEDDEEEDEDDEDLGSDLDNEEEDDDEGPEAVRRDILTKLIPMLLEKLRAHREVELGSGRTQLSRAVIRLVSITPASRATAFITSQLVTLLCNTLMAKEEHVREEAKMALMDVTKTMGAQRFGLVLGALRAALKQGRHLDTLAHTTCLLLSALANNGSEMLATVTAGSVCDVLVSEATRSITNSRSNNSRPANVSAAFGNLARLVSLGTPDEAFGAVGAVLSPLSELARGAAVDVEMTKCISSLLRAFAAGILENETCTVEKLLPLLYLLVNNNSAASIAVPKPKNSDLAAKGAADNLARGGSVWIDAEKAREDAKREAEKKFLMLPPVSPCTASLNTKGGVETNAHLLAEFGLRILQDLLKQNKVDWSSAVHLGMVDPLVGVLCSCLDDPHMAVLAGAFVCLSSLLPRSLPSLTITETVASIVDKTVAVIRKMSRSRGPVLRAAFRLVASVMTKNRAKYSVPKETLSLLVGLIAGDVDQLEKEAATFALLRAVVESKVVAPEVYDLMEKAQILIVRSPDEAIRAHCSELMLLFIVKYPMSSKRRNQHITFFVKNLSYEHAEGRMASLEVLHQMIASLPAGEIFPRAQLMFLSLTAMLLNDDSKDARGMAGVVIKELIGVCDEQHFNMLYALTLNWFEQEKTELLRAALQSVGFFAEASAQRMRKHVEETLPHLQRVIDRMAATWESSYFCLVALEKLAQACADLPAPSPVHAFLESRLGHWSALLSHSHAWVRAAAARVVCALLQSPKSHERVDAAELANACSRLCGNVASVPNNAAASAQHYLRALVLSARVFDALPEAPLPTAFSSDTGLRTAPASVRTALEWLCWRVGVAAELAESSMGRQAALKWTAAVAAAGLLRSQLLIELALTPSLRLLAAPKRKKDETEGVSRAERELAEEVVRMIRQHAEASDYLEAQKRVASAEAKAREARRRADAIDAIARPQELWKRKQAEAAKRTATRAPARGRFSAGGRGGRGGRGGFGRGGAAPQARIGLSPINLREMRKAKKIDRLRHRYF